MPPAIRLRPILDCLSFNRPFNIRTRQILLLIFFMLTSRFVVHEGIQVQLPVTDKPQSVAVEKTHRLTVLSDGVVILEGNSMTLKELGRYLDAQDAAFWRSSFEILSDRRTSVQTVVTLLEILRERGATSVSLGTVRGEAVN